MPVSTVPQSGVGIALCWEDPSGSTYTAMLLLQDGSGFDGFDNAEIPVTTALQNFVFTAPGRTDNGTYTGKSYLVPSDAGVQKLISLFASKTTENWQVVLNNGTTPTTVSGSTVTLGTGTAYQFAGWVKNLTLGEFSGDKAPDLSFTIRIVGVITPVAAT